MHRRSITRTLLLAACGLGLGLALPACSAILDIDSLEGGKEDGQQRDLQQPYDMAPVGRIFGLPAGTKVALAAGGQVTTLAAGQGELTFRWRDLPGRPSNVDLALVDPSQGTPQPLLQVFSRDRRPFLRLGLRVLSLSARETYRVSYQRRGDQVQLQLRSGTRVLTQARLVAGALDLEVAAATFGGRRIELLAATEARGATASTVRTAGVFAAAIPR